jgi:predicted transposase/invertase (TIGR01784 family)
MKIQNVHDKFFKETFSRIDVATNFLEELLDEKFVKKLNLSTLTMDNNSFVDEELEEHFADILYTCEYGDKSKVRIALLYEHKSYKEDYPHWQLIQYMINVWKSGFKQNKEKPIPVIPIILYHGKEKWVYQSMTSYFENLDEDLRKYIPDFEYHLINLNNIPDKQITDFKNKFLSISALLFKHSRYKKYVKKIENNLVELLKLIDNQGNNLFTTSVVLYIQNTDDLTFTELFAIFTKVSTNLNNTIMTTAEQLISQGFNQGINQGFNQGINQGFNQGIETKEIDAVKRGYSNGISNELLSNILNLPVQKIEEIIAKIKLGLL